MPDTQPGSAATDETTDEWAARVSRETVQRWRTQRGAVQPAASWQCCRHCEDDQGRVLCVERHSAPCDICGQRGLDA